MYNPTALYLLTIAGIKEHGKWSLTAPSMFYLSIFCGNTVHVLCNKCYPRLNKSQWAQNAYNFRALNAIHALHACNARITRNTKRSVSCQKRFSTISFHLDWASVKCCTVQYSRYCTSYSNKLLVTNLRDPRVRTAWNTCENCMWVARKSRG